MFQNGYSNAPMTFHHGYNTYYVNSNNRNPKYNQRPQNNNAASNGPPQPDQYGSPRYDTYPSQKKWQDRRYPRDVYNSRNSSDSSARPRRGPEQMHNSVEQGEPRGAKPRVRFPKPFPQQQQQQQHVQQQVQKEQPQPPLQPDPEPPKEEKVERKADDEAEQEIAEKEPASNPKGRYKDQDKSLSAERPSNGDRVALRNGNRNGGDPYRMHPDSNRRDSYERRRNYNNQRNFGAHPSLQNHNKPFQNGHSTERVNSSTPAGNNSRNNFNRRFNHNYHHNNNNNHVFVTAIGHPVSAKQFNELNHPQEELPIPGAVPPVSDTLATLQGRKDLIITPDIKTYQLKAGARWDELSAEIWNKFIANQQCGELLELKLRAWALFYKTLRNEFGENLYLPDKFTTETKKVGARGLYLVGSTFNGFALNSSDIDICFMVHNKELDRYDSVGNLDRIMRRLITEAYNRNVDGLMVGLETVELIYAKVPILKFWDEKHMIQFDINCNNPVGVRNTHLLFYYSKLEPRVKPLVILVKTWAKFHCINDAKEMTLSSYSLTLMVIHYLQCGVRPVVLPCLQKMNIETFSTDRPLNILSVLNFPDERVKPFQSLNKQNLGELLIGFFEYYATFNFKQKAISVRLGSTVTVESCKNWKSPKNDINQWKNICIEEPFDQTNTARSVFDDGKFQYIVEVFRYSAKVLAQTRRLDSIFVRINNPLVYHLPPPPLPKLGC